METKTKKKLGIIPKIIISIILIGAFIYTWMHFIETKIITVKDYYLTNEKIPKEFNGFTIVHFSDIHFGRTTNEKELLKVVEKINDSKPDLVLFSGDLFDPYITLSDNNITFLKDTLKKINSTIKKYAVYGDNDYLNKEKFDEILKYADFEILNGENKSIYYNDSKPIYINGIGSVTNNKIDVATLKETDSLQLFLSHEPSVISDVKNKADFLFSGHTLGGLIRIPFIGGIKKNANTLNYEKGIYQIEDTTLFVNPGIGTEDYSLRLFNYPTIYCYRIKI